MGALGSYIHAGTFFVSYVGNRNFVASWTWWYVLRPFIGLALAVIFFTSSYGRFVVCGCHSQRHQPLRLRSRGRIGGHVLQAGDR